MAKVTYECKRGVQYLNPRTLQMCYGCGHKQEYESSKLPEEIYCYNCGNRLR